MTIVFFYLHEYQKEFKLMKKLTQFLFLQAVECYLANVIPPNGSEWPFESAIHLEQLTNTSRQPQMRVSAFPLCF